MAVSLCSADPFAAHASPVRSGPLIDLCWWLVVTLGRLRFCERRGRSFRLL